MPAYSPYVNLSKVSPDGLGMAETKNYGSFSTTYDPNWILNQSLKPADPVAAVPMGRRSAVVTNLLSGAAREAGALGRTTVATTRSPEVAKRTTGLYSQYDANQATKKQSIADFVNELIANKPKNLAARDQEAASIDRVYATGAGSLQAELDANRRAASVAARTAAQQAMGRAGRDRNVAQMTGGNSSYLARAYGDSLARIGAEQAAKNAAIERENILYTQGQRSNMLGTRGRLNEDFANTFLRPIDALNQYQSGEASRLGEIAGLEGQNTDYESFTPEQSIAQQMALQQQLEELEAMGIDPSQFFPQNRTSAGVPAVARRSISSRLLG